MSHPLNFAACVGSLSVGRNRRRQQFENVHRSIQGKKIRMRQHEGGKAERRRINPTTRVRRLLPAFVSFPSLPLGTETFFYI